MAKAYRMFVAFVTKTRVDLFRSLAKWAVDADSAPANASAH